MRPTILLLCFHLLFSDQVIAQESTTAPSEAGQTDILAPYRDAAVKRWQKTIDEFDQQNQTAQNSSDAVLFIGSSSIRRWESMETDMAPFKTIRRGYGGAKFTDMAIFADRLIQPHQYRALVMFVGNGVNGKPDDHSPDLIEALTRQIVAKSHAHQPDVPVFLIEITPCKKRFDAWQKIRAVNARLREVALSTPHTYFIPTASHYLRPDGTPRTELFVEDNLHLNADGYQLWSTLIRRRLSDVIRQIAGTTASDHAKLVSEATNGEN
ncbi:GDSL-type esterase/lipase family protein [Planctomycetes bacterium K23_9]|uniref:SGNH hydrolase-type esterase domain-containing protein n=1 Tax=Stieleria marina TaxID=1930275 RepID=A0A517P1M9_9BACT|nr:hypothetical protein K239x_52830 [Planctomycetes bacterium K23_9]